MGDQNTYFDFCTVDLHSDAPAENSKTLKVLTGSLSHRTHAANTERPYTKIQTRSRV
jgi:hypothetical protein